MTSREGPPKPPTPAITQPPSASAYERTRTRSYQLLDAARKKTKKYDSLATRAKLQQAFTSKFGKPAYDWQVDVSEAILLRLDTILIAGTGCGKTIPFMMPLLLDSASVSLIVSPLKILQAEQAARFQELGISAVAVNGDTWSKELGTEIAKRKYQAIFASPEMYKNHDAFRKAIREISQKVISIIIDEAHCISQWGGEFRKDYATLDCLRTLVPSGTPILAVSATVNRACLKDVSAKLSISSDSVFHLNLGNDRPNIATEVHRMKSSNDFAALDQFLPLDATGPDEMPKTIIFTNSLKATQHGARHIREKFPPHLRHYIDSLHAQRSVNDKKKVMKLFKEGKIRILIATEAAGMGADISDIEVVIQFGVPSSLSVFKQRIGRGGRDKSINARAILLVEQRIFVRQKVRQNLGVDEEDLSESDDDEAEFEADQDAVPTPDLNAETEDIQQPDMELDMELDEPVSNDAPQVSISTTPVPVTEALHASTPTDSASTAGSAELNAAMADNAIVSLAMHLSQATAASDANSLSNPALVRVASVEDDGKEWGKKVEPAMRAWIEEKECERKFSDKYYNNPPTREPPTGLCCDRCTASQQLVVDSRPVTPEPFDPLAIASTHSTPSKTRNANGKRPMQPRGIVPAVRRDKPLQDLRAALNEWRLRAAETWPSCPYRPVILLPNKTLTQIASNGRIMTVEDLRTKLNPPWYFAEELGESLLEPEIITHANKLFLAEKAATKRQKAEKTRQAKVKRQNAEAQERARKAQERMQGKENQQLASMAVAWPQTPLPGGQTGWVAAYGSPVVTPVYAAGSWSTPVAQHTPLQALSFYSPRNSPVPPPQGTIFRQYMQTPSPFTPPQ